jgi:hypothetical protein
MCGICTVIISVRTIANGFGGVRTGSPQAQGAALPGAFRRLVGR